MTYHDYEIKHVETVFNHYLKVHVLGGIRRGTCLILNCEDLNYVKVAKDQGRPEWVVAVLEDPTDIIEGELNNQKDWYRQ